MPHLLRVPEIAANTTEATLVSWPVAENATYTRTDVIAVVETSKAVVDVEAEADGVLLKRLVAEGTDVGVGEPIALLGAPGESVDDLAATLRDLGVGAATPQQPAPPEPVAETTNGSATRLFASPIARRLAKDAGLALADLTGTGPDGRILRRDVEQALTKPVPPKPIETPPPPAAEPGPATGYVDTPHSRSRRAIAERLTESKQTVPHFYLRASARVTALLALRRELNESSASVRISVNDLIVKAVARAHTLVPAMNAIWTPEAIRRFETVDLGVAIASERGLITPVLRSVDSISVSTVATRVRDLAERAAAGRIQQRELEGGASTVSNLGRYGTEEFAAIINPPQSSILAVGAAREEPYAEDGVVRAGSVLHCTVSVDHRVIDGALAAEWMRAFVSLLEHPIQILA
ncbi:MAG TPA: dihydrolipoamide acetyltransferase family protein [Pseudonocardiaceae bacterium]|nr:dihydrolipoamide acetyltransferase family protein [Pseudonocardiaceae bacterium]